MVVGAGVGEGLGNVPVLDDLAVLEPPEVGDDRAGIVVGGLEEAVGDDDVALGDDSPDVEAKVGDLADEAGREPDERLDAVGRLGVVLDVLGAEEPLGRVGGPLGVERELVELANDLLVALDVADDRGSLFRAGRDLQRTLVQVPVIRMGLPSSKMLVTTSPLL